MNQTVMEGGDATFSCNATVNGARQPLSYSVGNITDLSLVNGVVGACILGEFRTQLILKGVTREADGYTVTCLVEDNLLLVGPENKPPAFIAVMCMSFDVH